VRPRTIMDAPAIPTRKITKPRGVSLKRLALPHEHGSWSILLEPLIGGIAVAASPASPFMALLFIGGFLAHQPLRICLTDLWNRRRMPHTVPAIAFAVGFAAIAMTGLAGTWVVAGMNSLVPLLAAAPLALLQLGYDRAGKSRRLMPEIAGAVALSTSAAVAAHAAGWPPARALALSGIFVLRLIPSLLYVRSRLLIEKRKAAAVRLAITANGLALAAAVVLAFTGLSSKITIVAFAILFARACVGLSSRRLKLRAMQIGVLEITFGALTVLCVVADHYFHI
jgi:hypothetical protein